jgi:glycosyltransferase involved in cell wall biosynthesis
METVSIIIPANNDKYLNLTIADLKSKAGGSIEIIVVLDGADAERLEGVTYIYFPQNKGMRYAINAGVAIAKGKYIMKIDAHCIVAPGFDLQLIKDHQDNWIQIPRRYKLMQLDWTVNFTDWIDYEYYIFPPKYPTTSLHGFRWYQRANERKDVLLDDTLTFQGSFWFMTRTHWDRNNFMQDEGYNQLHAQEAAYLGNTTWFTGGRVVVNKNTWYAHWHKKKQDGRGYHMNDVLRRECYKYSYKHWVTDNKENFIKLVEKFWPLPNWPANWQERLWKN